MPITGFLKIDDIPGESQRAGHEDEIDIFGLDWAVESLQGTAAGRGRRRARSDMKPVRVRKFTDAASVYLAQDAQRGKSFPEMVIAVRKDSGEAHLDYLVITMENVMISSFSLTSDAPDVPEGTIAEEVEFDFEKVTLRYVVQDADGSSGGTHEVKLEA